MKQKWVVLLKKQNLIGNLILVTNNSKKVPENTEVIRVAYNNKQVIKKKIRGFQIWISKHIWSLTRNFTFSCLPHDDTLDFVSNKCVSFWGEFFHDRAEFQFSSDLLVSNIPRCSSKFCSLFCYVNFQGVLV